MKIRNAAVAAGAICASTFGMLAAAHAAQPVPYLPVPRGAAVILNTGSTNFAGYRIVVQRSGDAEYVHGDDRRQTRIEATLASKFYADLRTGMPLSRLHVLACMKSASFGSETYVWWQGQRSPDISCPGSAQTNALSQDVAGIAAALGLAGGSATLPPTKPRNSLPSAAPFGATAVRARPT